jgi:MFS family permease
MTALLTFLPSLAQSFWSPSGLDCRHGILGFITCQFSPSCPGRKSYGMGLTMASLMVHNFGGSSPFGRWIGIFRIKTIFYGAAFLGLIGIVFCFCTAGRKPETKRKGSVCLHLEKEKDVRKTFGLLSLLLLSVFTARCFCC